MQPFCTAAPVISWTRFLEGHFIQMTKQQISAVESFVSDSESWTAALHSALIPLFNANAAPPCLTFILMNPAPGPQQHSGFLSDSPAENSSLRQIESRRLTHRMKVKAASFL